MVADISNIVAIERIIVEIAALLRDGKVDQWSIAFERFAAAWSNVNPGREAGFEIDTAWLARLLASG